MKNTETTITYNIFSSGRIDVEFDAVKAFLVAKTRIGILLRIKVITTFGIVIGSKVAMHIGYTFQRPFDAIAIAVGQGSLIVHLLVVTAIAVNSTISECYFPPIVLR